MDTLDNTEYDVLIVGTGMKQSLLALALSRSDKKILHIDKNKYYGGAETALSLQEAEEWSKKVESDPTEPFGKVSISKPEQTSEADPSRPSLSPPRSYNLELSPQIIYARSSFLQSLISSKVYRQLDFLAVGSLWVYDPKAAQDTTAISSSFNDEYPTQGRLVKVPNGREDIFNDEALDFKSKRALMKFLRFIGDYEDHSEDWEEHRHQPFQRFLTERFRLPTTLHGPLLALALSSSTPSSTTTEFALTRIARHLRSIGFLGAGFSSIIPKWGGLSEITQVACRAGAVGGGVYVLDKGLSNLSDYQPMVDHTVAESTRPYGIKAHLEGGETVTASWIVKDAPGTNLASSFCRSITIVSSAMTALFPRLAEEAPPPACAVVVFPSGTLSLAHDPAGSNEAPPVNILVYSNDTNECPSGQSILYASTALGGDEGFELLEKAVQALLHSQEVAPVPEVLWHMRFEHNPSSSDPSLFPSQVQDQVLLFTPSSLDVAFNDSILNEVKTIWEQIVGDDSSSFLVFEDREANVDDE